MPPPMFNARRLPLVKRGILEFTNNIGGKETNVNIDGTNNKIMLGPSSQKEEEETLLKKTGTQVGRLLEGGTDIVVAPAKWLNHMLDNWLIYLVCATIVMIGIFFISYRIRRKAVSFAGSSIEKSVFSKLIMDEAMKMAISHHQNALEK